MFTLRSTRRLLDRLRVSPVKTPEPPSTRLGDWYANLLSLEAGEYVLCVSEKTLLPVVLPIMALPVIALELSKALSPILAQLGVEKRLIEQERFAMAQSSFGTTASRHIVGFMNEFAFMASTRLSEEATPLTELSLWLAGTPCKMCFPDNAGAVLPMSDVGTYILVMRLMKGRTIKVGVLDPHFYEPGHYLYVGSAMKGLRSRTDRHRKASKLLKWHIDYLRRWTLPPVVWASLTTRRLECRWAEALARRLRIPVPGFGSSDCRRNGGRCLAHLFFQGTPVSLADVRALLGRDGRGLRPQETVGR